MSLTDCRFANNRFQKTGQLVRGQGRTEFTVDIRCIGISGKVTRSMHPKVDLLFYRNVWKWGLKCTPDVMQVCSLHTFA